MQSGRGVEGTIHQAVAVTGVRRCRYLGLPKTRLVAHILAATALNLIRLDAWWTGPTLRQPPVSHLTRLDLGLPQPNQATESYRRVA
jgi:hypothetical protein